jgi:hypothetical protein
MVYYFISNALYMRHLITLLFVSIAFLSFSQSDLDVQVLNLSTLGAETGINVVVENPSTGYISQKTSDSKGYARFAISTAGTYLVYATSTADRQLVDTMSVQIRSQEAAYVAILMYNQKTLALNDAVISGRQNRITTINRRNAEVSSELTAAEIQTLPIEGRDISRALFRLPNITQATGFYPEAPNVAINGANSLFTNYLIDGMDNNENFLGGQRFAIPIGFTENITVLTNNYSPEFGLTANGIINITSKSGTNTQTGEVFYLTRPGSIIDAESPYAQRDLSGNQVKDGFQRQQGGFGIGGAIRPNKTFYYVNADNLLNSPALGVNTTVRGTNEFLYLSGRLDHRWNNRHQSMLRVNSGLVSIERQGGGLDGGVTFQSAGNTQDRNSLNVAARHTITGNNVVSETNFLYGHFLWDYASPNNPDNPNVTVLGPDDQAVAVLGHPGYVFKEQENTFQLQEKLTWYLGNHTLKAGAQMKSSGFALFGGGNPNGSYTVKLNQTQLDALAATNPGADLGINQIPGDAEVLFYGVELRPESFENRQNIYSIYAEDQINVSQKLNVNVGLRYDIDDLSKGGSDKVDMNNIAPRLSANYQVGKRGTVRFGYGLFYEKILYAVYSDAVQFSSTSAGFQAQIAELANQGILPAGTDVSAVTTAGNVGGSISGVTYLNGPSGAELQDQRENIFQNELRILNPNGYQNPYSHQLNLGYQYQANRDVLFYVDVVHNQSYNLFRLRDLNAPEAYNINTDNVEVRTPAEADATRPIPIMSDDNGNFAVINGDTLRGISRNIMMTETEGRSRYWAASFTFNKAKGDDNYALRMVYTLSRLENNTEDINFRAMDSNNFDNEWGPSINDRTHVINTFLTYYPFKNFSATVAALMQSGQPINRIPDATLYGTTDLNGDGRSFGDAYVGNSDRSPGEDRNSDRLPWSTTFDVNLAYNIPLCGKNMLGITASVFNAMNAENLSGYSNNATQSNQIQVGPAASGVLVRRNAAPPRQFQFGLRYSF